MWWSNGVSNSPFLVDKFIGVRNEWCKHGRPRKWANHIASHQFGGSQHKCPFESIIAIDIMLQFTKAMWYFHDRKIAHKDLKSTNVFVFQPKRTKFQSLGWYLYVKLVDFGIFKLYNKIETNGTQHSNKGINIYVTLEVKFGKQLRVEANGLKFLPKVDVWSFAMMFENSY